MSYSKRTSKFDDSSDGHVRELLGQAGPRTCRTGMSDHLQTDPDHLPPAEGAKLQTVNKAHRKKTNRNEALAAKNQNIQIHVSIRVDRQTKDRIKMSDFPELEDFSNVPASNDPQADFLARERALLGDEFGPTPDNYQETRQEQVSSQNQEDQFGLGDFDSSPIDHSNIPAPNLTGPADELASFQDQYPDISHDISSNQTVSVPFDSNRSVSYCLGFFGVSMRDCFHAIWGHSRDFPNGFDAPAPSLYANQPSAYATPAVYAQTQSEEESTFITEWRTKQAEEIRLRDQRSIAKREETIAAAEKAIDDFYHGYNTEKQKNIAKNKEEEAEFLQTRNDKLGQGTTWERISEVIELQDSRSKTCGKSNKDLARFKEILLSLKREGESAPGAAGY
ncbi:hypothetical protein PSHT_13853 [Puccinia striiformis]|uniref:Clathrin light chain n=1 Tax=Puccinia striiformis TaxID=27350 RepID=A0A2S4UNB3_9BASI|nr:hypothetical protein PSHT_13853 [Puccinia striiformis]